MANVPRIQKKPISVPAPAPARQFIEVDPPDRSFQGQDFTMDVLNLGFSILKLWENSEYNKGLREWNEAYLQWDRDRQAVLYNVDEETGMYEYQLNGRRFDEFMEDYIETRREQRPNNIATARLETQIREQGINLHHQAEKLATQLTLDRATVELNDTIQSAIDAGDYTMLGTVLDEAMQAGVISDAQHKTFRDEGGYQIYRNDARQMAQSFGFEEGIKYLSDTSNFQQLKDKDRSALINELRRDLNIQRAEEKRQRDQRNDQLNDHAWSLLEQNRLSSAMIMSDAFNEMYDGDRSVWYNRMMALEKAGSEGSGNESPESQNRQREILTRINDGEDHYEIDEDITQAIEEGIFTADKGRTLMNHNDAKNEDYGFNAGKGILDEALKNEELTATEYTRLFEEYKREWAAAKRTGEGELSASRWSPEEAVKAAQNLIRPTQAPRIALGLTMNPGLFQRAGSFLNPFSDRADDKAAWTQKKIDEGAFIGNVEENLDALRSLGASQAQLFSAASGVGVETIKLEKKNGNPIFLAANGRWYTIKINERNDEYILMWDESAQEWIQTEETRTWSGKRVR